MAHKDGDGWVDCVCGNRHWGKHGAAGLLLVRDRKVLLQHRAPWVHDGWSYDTVIAKADPNLIAHEQNDESLQVEWIAFADIAAKELHPSFAKTWPALLARLEILFV